MLRLELCKHGIGRHINDLHYYYYYYLTLVVDRWVPPDQLHPAWRGLGWDHFAVDRFYENKPEPSRPAQFFNCLMSMLRPWEFVKHQAKLTLFLQLTKRIHVHQSMNKSKKNIGGFNFHQDCMCIRDILNAIQQLEKYYYYEHGLN